MKVQIEFDKDNLFEKDDIAGMSDTEVMALIHDLLQEDLTLKSWH